MQKLNLAIVSQAWPIPAIILKIEKVSSFSSSNRVALLVQAL